MIEQDIKMVIEPIYEGFGDNTRKIGDFYFTLNGSEIATGKKDRKKFEYQLHMGELERLELLPDMQIIVHTISSLANKHFRTGWTFEGYDKDSWSRAYDYYKMDVPDTVKKNFIAKLQKMQNERKEKA